MVVELLSTDRELMDGPSSEMAGAVSSTRLKDVVSRDSSGAWG